MYGAVNVWDLIDNERASQTQPMEDILSQALSIKEITVPGLFKKPKVKLSIKRGKEDYATYKTIKYDRSSSSLSSLFKRLRGKK